jgi:hypothetical protein
MPSRRLSFVAAVLALVLVPTAAVQGAVDPSGPARPTTRADDLLARELADRTEVVPGQFTGIDGLLYQSAPYAVSGLDGQLFYGVDFDVACGIGGSSTTSMRAITKLARVIQRSGRRVVWAAGPNAPSVLGDEIGELPHGACDSQGLAQQRAAVDSIKDPNFLKLRAELARHEHQTYFRTDPHWTTVGASVFARAVARRLSPRLGKRQHYVYGTESRVGLLNSARGIDTPEVAETALPRTDVVTRTAKGSVEDFAGYPGVVVDHSWVSGPARKTWPGHTLLLGDSFMLFALAAMRPIFRSGRFMWVGHTAESDIVAQIKRSDTVVIEILQTFVPLGSPLVSKSFRSQVARALR